MVGKAELAGGFDGKKTNWLQVTARATEEYKLDEEAGKERRRRDKAQSEIEAIDLAAGKRLQTLRAAAAPPKKPKAKKRVAT